MTDRKPGRPKPDRLDGCTCGGIGTTGAHAAGCPWGRWRRSRDDYTADLGVDGAGWLRWRFAQLASWYPLDLGIVRALRRLAGR